uniref:GW182 middle domain-containing protein n=2 Tax=Parascaris univalens TaxID=6257 RepID=A0A915C7J6_PARUN
CRTLLTNQRSGARVARNTNMWGVEDSAETMAMNPWNGVAQSQVWPAMGRGSGGQPTFSGVRMGDARGGRSWVEHQPVQAPAAQWNTQPSAQPTQWAVPPNQPTGPQGPTGWPLSQQAWSGTTSSPSGTYAEQAKKNMAQMGGRAQAPNTRYDQPQSWGGLKVDQQTPWDTGSGASAAAMHGGDQKGDWGGAGAASRWSVGAPAAPWTAPHPSGSADWPHHRHDPTGTTHWNSAQPHPAALVQTGVPAASWAQPQPGMPAPSDQYDPNPQTPGPWVAPQPTEMNNDMMWHDPNPKQKKVQRDTGTSVWGDPSSQQGVEIKRWKDADVEDYSHVPCAAPSGGDWSNIPVSSGVVSNNASPSATAAVWGDPQPAPGHPLNDGTERWGAPPQTSAWGEPTKVVENSTEASQSPPDLLPANGGAANPAVNTLIENIRPGECGGAYSSLTQQIADQLRIAVSKGLIDVSLLSRPLPQSTLVVLNTILQKLSKLEQAQQEYSHVTRTISSPSQKMESDRLLMEIQGLQNEIMQLRNSINEPFMKGRPQNVNGTVSLAPADGQSRLNQWKQANPSDGNSEKITSSSSDNNVPALIAGTQHMSLDDKIDWKSGTLDWSPPGSTAGERTANVDSAATANAEREEAPNTATKVPTSTSHSADGTPTPPVDDGPQEFVPGKKWEWRDPNKVAEDPNATPGNCKPNPLLSATSFGANVAQNYLNEISINKGAYLGWNGIQASAYGSEMWNGRSRPPSAVSQPFAQRLPGGQMPQASYARSISSPAQQQFQFGAHWILIQLAGINEKQVHMVCQKVGQILQFFCPPASSFVCVKFTEPVDAILARLKAEVPFIQLKVMPESEMERLIKMRGAGAPILPMGAASGWGAAAAPAPDSWAFGAGAVVAGDMMQQQQQQHIFHSDDLSRPF